MSKTNRKPMTAPDYRKRADSCFAGSSCIYLGASYFLGGTYQLPETAGVLCNNLLSGRVYIKQLCEIVYGYKYFKFSADVLEHIYYWCMLLCDFYGVCNFSSLLYVKNAF